MFHSTHDTLLWSGPSAFGACLGYLLHWLMSWSEWRKVGGHAKLRLWDFLSADPPGAYIGLVSTVIVYFSLPMVDQWPWLVERLGFVPKVNFFSAAVTAYCSNSIAIKLRNMSRRIEGDGNVDCGEGGRQ